MKRQKVVASPRHHAMLFSMIVKEARESIGENAEETIKKGVIKYALQRGGRMAKRTIKDGFELTSLNYLAYGEWEAQPGDMDIRFDNKEKDLNMKAYKCPWYDTWNTNNILDYGKPYCAYVDEYLAKGYSENVVLELESNRTAGGEVCDFYFRTDSFTEKDWEILKKRKEMLGNKAKKDWDYHTGHIYKVMKTTFEEEFKEEGKKIIKKVEEKYQEKYGEEALERLKKYETIDYESVDDYKGIEA